jgi:cell division protein FtsI (penicillin-binding protein 3)
MGTPKNQKKLKWIRVRLYAAAAVFGCLFIALVVRAFALQVVDGDRMRKLARNQYRRKVSLPGARGRIVDRHGSPLAVSVEVPSVYANPQKLKGREREVARALAGVLDHDPYLLEERFRSDRYFVWVKRKVSPEESQKVQELGLEGVNIKREMRRFYPNGRLAGHVLGFSGLEGNGLEGIELHFERWLKPSRSTTMGLRDALGRAIFVDGLPDLGPATGNEVVLTIDKNIQFEADRALAAAVEEHDAKGGALVVMDPKTGQILAMSSAPTFDPNNHTMATPDDWRNRPVTDAFEPGSVTKVFTLAAALETKVAKPTDNVYCEDGRIEVDDYPIRDSHPHKWLTVTECIQKSSNICTFKLAQRLGKRRLYTYLRQFGFGTRSGVELPGERYGRLRHWRRWSRVALANISFGQGFTATAVQIAAAVAALANGGTLYVPHVVRSIRDANQRVVALYRPRGRRAISRWVSKKVVSIMETVIRPGGTGVLAALDDYPVAGKTGTAQKVDPETGRYSKEHWVASFVGIVPADDPALAVVVLIDEPQEKYYGGEVAAPVFRQVAKAALEILGVPRRKKGKRRARSRRGKKRGSSGTGLSTGRSVAPPLPVAQPSGPVREIPDFTGMGLHEVLETARKAGLSCKVEGSGIAVNQSPPPGPAPKEAECRVGLQGR